MTNEHVERNKALEERLERFVKERGMFPLYILGDTLLINNLLDIIEEQERKSKTNETQEHVELNEKTRARFDKRVERGAFPLHLACKTKEDLINALLNEIERLEDKCERLKAQADLERERC
jgi:predicted RNase H-like nuclease (RuvC/YqgF family)